MDYDMSTDGREWAASKQEVEKCSVCIRGTEEILYEGMYYIGEFEKTTRGRDYDAFDFCPYCGHAIKDKLKEKSDG